MPKETPHQGQQQVLSQLTLMGEVNVSSDYFTIQSVNKIFNLFFTSHISPENSVCFTKNDQQQQQELSESSLVQHNLFHYTSKRGLEDQGQGDHTTWKAGSLIVMFCYTTSLVTLRNVSKIQVIVWVLHRTRTWVKVLFVIDCLSHSSHTPSHEDFHSLHYIA